MIDRPSPRRRSPAKTPDLKPAALKQLNAFRNNRIAYGPGAHVRFPRVLLDIFPLAATSGGRLDLEAVKAARPAFAPTDDSEIESSTRQGQWISRGPVTRETNFINPVSLWATRLIAPGHLERGFSVGRVATLRSEQTQDGPAFDRMVLNALQRSGDLFNTIGLDGAALVSLSIDGCEDLRLGFDGAYRSPLGLHSMGFETILIDDLRHPAPEQLRPLLNDVWQAAGWEDGTPSISATGFHLGEG